MASRMNVFLVAVSTLHTGAVMAASPANIEPAIDVEEEKQVAEIHKTNSFTILMMLALLLLTILTIWFFKFRRFRFVHESGLSLVYGMIVGVIIRYASKPPDTRPSHAVIINNTYDAANPPESLFVDLPNGVNKTETIQYNLWGQANGAEELSPLVLAVTFDPELFFNVLLPFIIFEAGYNMKRRHFFKNLGAIMAYAFIGTTISCLAVGGMMYGFTRLMPFEFTLNDCFFFGAIISATDPVTVLSLFSDLKVDVDLFALVFGESVLNDAVAIVLSGSVEKYGKLSGKGFSANAFFSSLGNFVGIFAGAFAIGSVIASITALLTKFTKVRDFPLLETALFFVMSYSTFQAAEAAGLTGIVAVLFCGITQAHYTYNNLSVESKTRTKQLFELMNFLAENFVFIYIGVAVFTFHSIIWNAGFIFAAILSVIVARFFNIYPLSGMLNLGRKKKLSWSFMHMMMFAGLRGAIAFALSIRNTSTEARQLMVSATMMIVVLTVVLCGGLTTPMLQWLKIRVGVEEEREMSNLASEVAAGKYQRQYSTMENMEDSLARARAARAGTTDDALEPLNTPLLENSTEELVIKKGGKAYLVELWHNFDVRFMKPLLTNSRPTLIETLPACCFPLAKLLTTEEQLSQGEVKVDEDSDTDMIIDHREISIRSESNISTVSDQGLTNADINQTSAKVLNDDSMIGDLGLGSTDQPIHLRVNIPGPVGDSV